MSVRQAAREFGLSRKTIRKMLEFSVPPGYKEEAGSRPETGPWLGIMDQSWKRMKPGEKATAYGTADLRPAQGRARLPGGLHDREGLCAEARLRHKEVFVPLTHPPGDAQADFGEALAVVDGVEQKPLSVRGPAAFR
jgi:transposase